MALEPLRIPVFFWPQQYFHFWEIPIVIAFLLYGLKVGFAVNVIDAIGYVFIFPDNLGLIGPASRIIVMSTMFLGLLMAKKIASKNFSFGKKMNSAVTFTVLPTITRVAIMPFVDVCMFRFVMPYLMGIRVTDIYLVGLIPSIIAFNILLALYTLPVAYLTSKTVNTTMKIGSIL